MDGRFYNYRKNTGKPLTSSVYNHYKGYFDSPVETVEIANCKDGKLNGLYRKYNPEKLEMEYGNLDEPIDIKEQVLPSTPQRKGFTLVEWGGTEVDL